VPPFKRDSNRFKRLLGVFEKLRWKLSRFIYIGGSFVLLCVQVRCAGAGACRAPFVVCRSPAPVQQHEVDSNGSFILSKLIFVAILSLGEFFFVFVVRDSSW
jgi:hypothetical protein